MRYLVLPLVLLSACAKTTTWDCYCYAGYSSYSGYYSSSASYETDVCATAEDVSIAVSDAVDECVAAGNTDCECECSDLGTAC